MLARQRAPGGGVDGSGSGEVGERFGLSCGGRAVAYNLSVWRSSTGAPVTDTYGCRKHTNSEACHTLGAGGEGSWWFGIHVLQLSMWMVRAGNDHGIQLSAPAKLHGLAATFPGPSAQ